MGERYVNCPNCSSQILHTQNFCSICGTKIEHQIINQDFSSLSIDDIELILEDQLELYSEEEIVSIKKRLETLRTEEKLLREKQLKEEREKRILKVIKCPKCDGENPPSNRQCQYCAYTFKEEDYYERPEKQNKYSKRAEDTPQDNKGLYIIAFLIPLIGVLLGLIYIAKSEDALGKSLITTAIVGAIIIALIGLLLSGTLESILTDLSRETCHNCGKVITEDPLEAGGRTYCSYDCYMEEFLFE